MVKVAKHQFISTKCQIGISFEVNSIVYRIALESTTFLTCIVHRKKIPLNRHCRRCTSTKFIPANITTKQVLQNTQNRIFSFRLRFIPTKSFNSVVARVWIAYVNKNNQTCVRGRQKYVNYRRDFVDETLRCRTLVQPFIVNTATEMRMELFDSRILAFIKCVHTIVESEINCVKSKGVKKKIEFKWREEALCDFVKSQNRYEPWTFVSSVTTRIHFALSFYGKSLLSQILGLSLTKKTYFLGFCAAAKHCAIVCYKRFLLCVVHACIH